MKPPIPLVLKRPEADPQRHPRLQQGPRPLRLPAGLPTRQRPPPSQPLIAFLSFYQGQTKVFETQPMEVTTP